MKTISSLISASALTILRAETVRQVSGPIACRECPQEADGHGLARHGAGPQAQWEVGLGDLEGPCQPESL